MTDSATQFSPLAQLTKWRSFRQFNAPAHVTPEALNVTPTLLGKPLAKPSRRLWAILTDLALVGVLSSIAGLWIFLLAGFVGWRLRLRWASRSWRFATPLALLFGCLLFAGVQTLWGDLYPDAEPAVARVAEGGVTASAAVDKADKEATDAERISQLEHELVLAKQPKALRLGEELKAQLHELGARFGWAIVYFSLLPFFWRGQTVGKRLFGLRVVELTGKPLTLLHCFSRYGGYAAGMATGMFGFAQVFWDANRQAIQDKIAHTVVVDERAIRRTDQTAALLTE